MTQPLRKILATTDLSQASEPACVRASELAGPDTEITVLYVVDFGSHLPGGALTLSDAARKSVWDEVRGKAQPQLQALRERLLGGCSSVRLEVVDGHGAAHVISEYALENEIDLIVIATHGATGMRRHLLGSVAERVVRLAHCDVLVVRSHTARTD